MKISKVNTSSFAISAEFEKNIIKFSSDNPNVKLYKRYMPLGRLEIIKTEGFDKGILFKRATARIKRNHLYVDLSHGNLYYAHCVGILHAKPRVEKIDLLRRVIDFTPQMLNTLSYILDRGSVQYDELDQDTVLELVRRGVVTVYEPRDNKILNILRIAMDEREIERYWVRSPCYLPKFEDKRYDLSSFLEVVDTIDDSYDRDSIEYSLEKIGRVIRYLFNCDVLLEEITYMPYLVCEHVGRKDAETVSYFPLCPKNSPKVKRNYETEVKLKPISLGTEFDTGDSIPIEKSTISFSDVGGLENAKKEITEAIIYPFLHPDLSKKFKRKAGGGILLYGPPGCGKTHIARATVTECGVSFFNVNISDIMNGKGDGAERIHSVFERASKNAPAIIFFDEIDALCSRKGLLEGSKKRILNQFLMDMSGVERLSEDVLVIAATDTPWDLDPSLRRSGRFSKQIFIPPPDLDSRIEILKICTRGRPLSTDVDFRKLAELTEGYSAADIDEICNNAASIPWKKAVSGSSERSITMDDFLKAIEEQESTLIPWSISAEKLLKESGEKELYKDLFDTVTRLNRKFGQREPEDKQRDEEEGQDYITVKRIVSGEWEEDTEEGKTAKEEKDIVELQHEKDELEHKIEILEERYRQGKVREDIYKAIMKDYQERLIEIELGIAKLTRNFNHFS
ncbi:MAG: hypothetical protein DRO89_00095 [Candidatus Altiarchaeales archaeon]|nr:MAG: hypothetical protein DRO89_00095 [Candidatus Altiarchaeales archaeon]